MLSTTISIPPHPRTLIVGDSYTAGVGADRPDYGGWAYVAARNLDLDAQVDGIAGTGFAWGGGESDDMGREYVNRLPELANSGVAPELVILQGGQNDSLLNDPGEVSAAVVETVKTAQDLWPDAEVVVFGPSAPQPLADDLRTVAQSIRDGAIKAGAAFIDPSGEEWMTRENSAAFNDDGTHVNPDGHAYIAERFTDAFRRLTASTTEPQPVSVEWPEDGALDVLFAGDSLTGGLSARVETEGFKWLMLDELEQHGPIDEHNSALSGGTTLDVSADYKVPDDLELAVIELGTNDLGKGTPLDEFEAAYSGLVNRVVADSPDVALVCAGVWEGVGRTSAAAPYDNRIQAVCEEAGGIFVPLHPIYRDKAEVIGPVGAPAFGGEADDFHPNNEGHRRIADSLLDVLAVK